MTAITIFVACVSLGVGVFNAGVVLVLPVNFGQAFKGKLRLIMKRLSIVERLTHVKIGGGG
ncbi:MAG: hypothetical protein LBT09_01050 [Planctomycetaceae bacterium]|jgi:hypothetical protein|nr:hypothetical protein [Planctomycetaceae bacterium]